MLISRRRVIAVIGGALAAMGMNAALAAAPERGTAEEAQAMVALAVQHFQEKGDAVFADINAGGDFRAKDLYIFAYSTGADAKVVAYGGPPVDPSPLGRLAVDVKDADGKPLGQLFLETATAEGAWVDYRWTDPATGAPLAKSSWVVRSGDIIFGCGIYK